MTVIRVIFDGKSFVPQQPVTLPAQSEAIVILQQDDASAQANLDAEIRAYYQAAGPGGDAEDDAWGATTSRQSNRAWDED
jgi:hypothetical protein